MRFIPVVVLSLLLLTFSANANDEKALPSFGETILKEQFPEYKESSDVERGLRRYKVQLESFREEILEGYNRSVINYRQQLVDADSGLELDYKKGRINSEIYNGRHDYIKKELIKSSGSGEYLAAYFMYLNKYKTEIKWVNEEIAVEEKKKFKF
jgi:hypothetical protein